MTPDAEDQFRSSAQYFDPNPAIASKPRRIPLVLPDLTTELLVDRGVFSGERIDVGTRLLLLDGPELNSNSKTLVDVGCGYGPIAVTLAHRAPSAEVWAVDVNRRAVELAAANLAGYPKAKAVLTEDVPDGLTVDEVWSNPPIRIGKPAMHRLLEQWHGRLRPGGRMVLVVQKHLGADSLHRWCEAQGWPTERSRASARFRLLIVGATP